MWRKRCGLAAKGLGGVHQRVVVDLHERFELHAEALAVIQQRIVVVGHAPGAGVDVQALVELAGLARAVQLGERVAPAQCPATPTGTILVFQDLHVVAGRAQLIRRRHARQPGAQDDHRAAAPGLSQLQRSAVARLLRVAERCHRLVHEAATRRLADHGQQVAAAHLSGLQGHGVALLWGATARQSRLDCHQAKKQESTPGRQRDPADAGRSFSFLWPHC